MTLRIWQKLFLGTVTTVSAALLAMTLLMGQSFERGFVQYLKTFEALEVEQLKEQLVSAYQSQGNWSFLRLPPYQQQQQFGFSFTKSESRPGSSRDGRPGRQGRPPPPGKRPPPGASDAGPRQASGRANTSILNIAQRVSIVDLQDRTIAGSTGPQEHAVRHPISASDQVIGYLLVTPVPSLKRSEDLEFARRQSRNALTIGLAAMAIAALVSLWMARTLTAPLPRLADGTRKLAQGHYDERITINSNDELSQLGEDFNQLAGALDRQRNQQKRWIAQISHELRTPLAVITGEIHALRDGLRELNHDALESLDQEAQRLNHLVDDLYLLSVSEAGGNLVNTEPMDLAQLAEEFCRGHECISLTINQQQPAQIMGDPFRLRQLLNNLLQNSLRYCDNPVRIEVSLQPQGDHWQLTWEDSPPGVPEDVIEQLFDPLFRVEGSRARATGGAGLGLSIVHSVAIAHGGSVSAGPSRLGGLSIRLNLPNAGQI